MRKDAIIAALQDHKPELIAAGIISLRLHGSKARGDDHAFSDADLIADFDKTRPFTLLDMAGFENMLSDILNGMPVDLSPLHTLKEAIRDKAAREAVIVF